MRSSLIYSLVSVFVATFLGCAHPQPMKHAEGYSFAVAEKAADTALSLLGKPYKFKGETPDGFDCSGLVRYSYLTAGMNVPHSTIALRKTTYPVRYGIIRRGDLVFFTQLGKKYSHVGIYIGDDRFIHAPSSGKSVRIDNLADPYWKKYFLGARRF